MLQTLGLLIVNLILSMPASAEGNLAAAIIEAELSGGDQPPASAALLRYYRDRRFPSIWIEDGAVSPKLNALLAVIEHSDADGLEPAAYNPDDLRSLAGTGDSTALARLEAAASLAALRLATDLRAGRLAPRLVDPELFLQPRPIQAETVMNALSSGEDIAQLYAGWAPRNAEYRGLRRQLAVYRRILALGGWPALDQGVALQPGSIDSRVPILRRRLMAEGYAIPSPLQPELYDPALTAAVKSFQLRHGLEVDGIVGQETRSALSVPAAQRLRQIEMSMERLRWMPDDLGQQHILINIAAFELALVRDGQTVLEMPIAVGRPYRRTPVFTGQLTYLEFNPTWTVPPTILREDMLPKLRKNRHALQGQGFRVLDGVGAGTREIDPANIDWKTMTARDFPYRLRQDPGPKNPLGRVKFMLPNPHSIYLHDTPERAIFDKAKRAFSSGCIRLSRARDLAFALLSEQRGWALHKVDEALEHPRTQQVTLASPLAVHFTYMTAWADRDGTMRFREDLYGRDKRLDQALSAPSSLRSMPAISRQ